LNLNVIVNPLIDFFDLIVNGLKTIGISNLSVNYFLTICIFTLIIKSIILPLTIKQTKMTLKTQELQPKLKALQEKYKNDPKTLQQKQMEMYKENGANPLMGCLPLLVQLPIFMAMYTVIRLYHFNGIGFLWVKDLGAPDKSFILPILSGLSTYLSMLIVQPKGNDPSAKTQKQMGIFMSLFSVYIGFQFKAGLVLYWIIGNVIQMLQQYFIIGKVRKQAEEQMKLNSKNNENDKSKDRPKDKKSL
jgi:YidC/Oxa1 family membrane protein insertase